MGNFDAFGRLEMTQAVVTTSWDDGHPLDLRVAELLARYGLTGTFYVPLNCSHRQVMDKQQLLALRELGMEVGSHTMTHPQLTKITRESAMRELTESKDASRALLQSGSPPSVIPTAHSIRVSRAWCGRLDTGWDGLPSRSGPKRHSIRARCRSHFNS